MNPTKNWVPTSSLWQIFVYILNTSAWCNLKNSFWEDFSHVNTSLSFRKKPSALISVKTCCCPLGIIAALKLWQMIAAEQKKTSIHPDQVFSPHFWKQWHSSCNPHLMCNGWNRTWPQMLFRRPLCQEKDPGGNTGTWFKMFGTTGADSWLQQVPYYCGI